jgi:hypothetical protein
MKSVIILISAILFSAAGFAQTTRLTAESFREFMPQVSEATLGDDNGSTGTQITLPQQTFQSEQTSSTGGESGVVVQEEITAGVVVQEEITAGVVQEELISGRMGSEENHFITFIQKVTGNIKAGVKNLIDGKLFSNE